MIEKLKLHRVAAKFVPRLLTEEQKQNRVTVSQELLDRSNTDKNFLKNVITGDETWVYGYDVETKVQSINFRFQLSAQYFISVTMLLTCFGHLCAHPQEDLCIFTTSGSMSVSFGDRAVGRLVQSSQ